MPKMLYFITGETKLGQIDAFKLAKPAVSDLERAQALLDKVRAKTATQRFELLAIEASNAPGWTALGDKLDDDEILESNFEA